MKLEINAVSQAGLSLEENIAAASLDLETDLIKLKGPLNIKAKVSRITNTVTVDLKFNAVLSCRCSRCLQDFDTALNKNMRWNFVVDPSETVLDLAPQIREEIILDYPMKMLCRSECQGLCPGCGKNLNDGACSCATA